DPRRRVADLVLEGPVHRTGANDREEYEKVRREADELDGALAQRVKALGDWRKAYHAHAAGLVQYLEPGAVLIATARYLPQPFKTKPGERRTGEPRYAALLLCRGKEGTTPQL